jgi:hypothetical protein
MTATRRLGADVVGCSRPIGEHEAERCEPRREACNFLRGAKIGIILSPFAGSNPCPTAAW